MNSYEDWKQVVRRNKLVGMWAAEKLGKTGQDAEEYSNALAVGTLDAERSDVLSKIRKDFAAAGVVQSDEQIIQVVLEITECYLEEGGSGSQAFTAMSPAHFMCAIAANAGESCRRGDRVKGRCPLLAQSGHFATEFQCPLLGVKRT